ncbi:hypothetical protein C8J57DRAFT_1519049 [Mycena rebaudengoi]|nr:hypothetical protein C8J57DRAFT_1519049 [Mycena rebaudengoi]
MDVTLPSEVTSKTFIDTLPDHGRVRQSLKDPPLSFSQVCRQWRLVALSISDIWSAVASKLALPKFPLWFPRASASIEFPRCQAHPPLAQELSSVSNIGATHSSTPRTLPLKSLYINPDPHALTGFAALAE